MCAVEVYDDARMAQKIVPDYLKNRNLPKDQRVSKKKGEEAKPAAAPAQKPAARPAEKKAPEAKAMPKPEAGKEAKEAKVPAKAETKPKA